MSGLFGYWLRGSPIAKSRGAMSGVFAYTLRGAPVAAFRLYYPTQANGSLLLADAVFSGSADVIASAVGSLDASPCIFSGSADVVTSANGALEVAPCIFQGSADVIVSASGSLDLADAVFSGSSGIVADASGSLLLDDAVFSGAGGFPANVAVGSLLLADAVFSGAAPRNGPATFRESLYARLGAVPGIADLVDDRIYFGVMPQGSPRPAVTYSVASRTFGRWLESTNGTSRARVRVSCWGDTELAAAEVAGKIRSYFDGFQGFVGQVNWLYTNLENELDLPEPAGGGDDAMIYQVLLDFSITHSVSISVYAT